MPWSAGARWPWRVNWSDLRFYEAGLAVLILLAVLAAVLLKSRLAAIAALGVVGYGVALVFVLFGAPDLAMTQFLVETLTVILFVLVFYHLPESRIVSGRAARWRDAALAVAAGAVMTALVLVGTPENYPPISAYFAEHSVPRGPRPERRQRHPGGLPRAGHARRDHGPVGGRRRGVRPAQAAPEGGRRRERVPPARPRGREAPAGGPVGEAAGRRGAGRADRPVPAAGAGEGDGP